MKISDNKKCIEWFTALTKQVFFLQDVQSYPQSAGVAIDCHSNTAGAH